MLVEATLSYDGPAVDLWSCGATLYMFVTGKPPWDSKDQYSLMNKVKYDELTFPKNWIEMNLSIALKHLIVDLLKKEPTERLSLKQTMMHDWVTQEQSDPLVPFFSSSRRKLSSSSQNSSIFQDISHLKHMRQFSSKGRSITPIHRRISSLIASQPHNKSFCFDSRNGYGMESSLTELPLFPREGRTKQVVRFDSNTFGMMSSCGSSKSLRNTRSCINLGKQLDMALVDKFLEDIRRRTPGIAATEGDYSQVSGHLIANTNPELDALCSFYSRSSTESKILTGVSNPHNRRTASSLRGLPYRARLRRQGFEYAYSMSIGYRPRQEDRITIVENFSSIEKPVFFAGVFDGFGGPLVSEKVSKTLPSYISRRLGQGLELKSAVKQAIYDLNKNYLYKAARTILKDRTRNVAEYKQKSLLRSRNGTKSIINQYMNAGSTAAIAIVENTGEKKYLHLFWLGDSRIVLFKAGKPYLISIDHKSEAETEKARILAAGGAVIKKRVNGNLLVSRGFGAVGLVGPALKDMEDQCKYIINQLKTERKRKASLDKINEDKTLINGPFCFEPGIRTLEITKDFDFLLISSDGLYETDNVNDIAGYTSEVLRERIDLKRTADAVVKKFKANDNTSLVLIKFYS